MSFTVDGRLVILPAERGLPRWKVERNKLKATFPQFRFYAGNVFSTLLGSKNIEKVKGKLRTKSGTIYPIQVIMPESYPYEMPTIKTLGWNIHSDCPHKYDDQPLCVLLPERWSSNMTVAFLVAKTALWLHKYEIWQETGRWPGSDEHKRGGGGLSLWDELLDLFT